MALLTPQYLQTQQYQAAKDRYLIQKVLGLTASGIIGSGSFAVAQRAAGADMSVDVATGDAWVLGTDTTRQGAYLVTNDASLNIATTTTGIAWPVGNATNPRIDQIILRIFDTQDGSAANGNKSADGAQLQVLVGVPTAGATLSNRSGAAALPSSSIRLADVLMPAGATTVTTANIGDKRVTAGTGTPVPQLTRGIANVGPADSQGAAANLITHNLGVVPGAVILTPVAGVGGDLSIHTVSAVTATTFSLNTAQAGSGGTATVYWVAIA